MGQSPRELEKELEQRLKSTSYTTHLLYKTYKIGLSLSKIYFGQQNYGRCMQHALKMFNYFSSFVHRPYLTEFVSKLITCN